MRTYRLNFDPVLGREQRDQLLFDKPYLSPEQQTTADGIVNLLDELIDQAEGVQPTMRTLTITYQPPPEQFPDMDMKGIAAWTARVVPKKGEDFYVCNPMDELIAARDSGEPFVAHSVIRMQPKRVIIEPGTIARIEEV